MIKLGITREGKTPPDKRVPLTPKHCRKLLDTYDDLEIYVQPSPVRDIPDEEYKKAGIELREDLSNCDIIMGVKEVPIDMLIPHKTYLFFSHTFKEQPYNRDLLRAILDKKIRLIDYEVLTDDRGKRLIGFGRYAGIVGTYNGLLAVGKKLGRYSLKPAHKSDGRAEVERELSKLDLPKGFKIALTGSGRVANGAMEMLASAQIKEVSPEDYLTRSFDHPVYTHLSSKEYHRKKDGSSFEKSEFYENPERFESDFMKYAKVTDLYIAGHYWDADAPFVFTREDAKSPDFNIKVVADISCDIDGPVASTLRASTIADPLYGYDPQSESETDFMAAGAIGVMAVDNLPCELSKDASEDFGDELLKNIMPELLKKEESAMIRRASETTLDGTLGPDFEYLKDYVEGK